MDADKVKEMLMRHPSASLYRAAIAKAARKLAELDKVEAVNTLDHSGCVYRATHAGKEFGLFVNATLKRIRIWSEDRPDGNPTDYIDLHLYPSGYYKVLTWDLLGLLLED
jgi:hypothetical protein